MIVAMRTDYASAALESLRWPSSKVRKMAKLFYDRRCINRPHNDTVLDAWAYALRMKHLAEKATTEEVVEHYDRVVADVVDKVYLPPERTPTEINQIAVISRRDALHYFWTTFKLLRNRITEEHEQHAERRAWQETPGAAYVERRRKEYRRKLHKALQRSP